MKNAKLPTCTSIQGDDFPKCYMLNVFHSDIKLRRVMKPNFSYQKFGRLQYAQLPTFKKLPPLLLFVLAVAKHFQY